MGCPDQDFFFGRRYLSVVKVYLSLQSLQKDFIYFFTAETCSSHTCNVELMLDASVALECSKKKGCLNCFLCFLHYNDYY